MKSKKTVLIVIVIIVAVILLSVASWLIYKKFFKKNTDEKNDVPLTNDDGTPVLINQTQVVAGGPSDVKAFQDWMDIEHPNWVKGKNLNKGSGYGTYGPSTQAAWALWKTDFQKPAKLESSVNPYLNPFAGAYPVFNTNPNTNPTSNVATGYNAIGKYAYTKGSYTNVRNTSSLGNSFNNTFIGQANSGRIGKIKAYQATGWLSGPGWYQLDLTTTLVPSTAGLKLDGLVGSNPANAKSGYVREDGVVIQNS
jgi:hypothetical protein